MSNKRRPNKKEVAKMVVLHELGESDRAIGERLGRSHTTVKKYYIRPEVYLDPGIQKLVAQIREKEVNDLYLLGAKGRARLHEMLDDGEKLQMIPTIALVDRTFQQRRLLEGRSTSNVSQLTQLLEKNEDFLRSSKDSNDQKESKPPIDVTPS